MAKLKKYLKPFIFWFILMIFYLFILTFLNYLGLIKFSSIIKLNFIVVAILIFIFGILNGKSTTKRGYLEGIKWGLIISVILFSLNLIFYRYFNLNIFLYYLVILVSSIFGSVIGINLKKK